jgi:hypothetical protein
LPSLSAGSILSAQAWCPVDSELPMHAHAQSRDTDSSVHGNHAPVQRVDHHDHGSKTLAIVALVAACIALGMVTMYVILAAQLIDAKIEAATAEAEVTAREARTNSRVALDKVEDFRAKLAAKGVDVGPLDGH